MKKSIIITVFLAPRFYFYKPKAKYRPKEEFPAYERVKPKSELENKPKKDIQLKKGQGYPAHRFRPYRTPPRGSRTPYGSLGHLYSPQFYPALVRDKRAAPSIPDARKKVNFHSKCTLLSHSFQPFPRAPRKLRKNQSLAPVPEPA